MNNPRRSWKISKYFFVTCFNQNKFLKLQKIALKIEIDLDKLEAIMNCRVSEAKRQHLEEESIDESVLNKHISSRLYTNQLTFSQVKHYKQCRQCQQTTPVFANKPLFRNKWWLDGFDQSNVVKVDTKAVVGRPTPVNFMNDPQL